MPNNGPILKKILEDKILPLVRKPGRYLGCEINAAHAPWHESKIKFCLLFPDLYEIGMSHLGLHILYSIINNTNWALADRAYCPDTDLEQMLRQYKFPLWGLESGRALKEFDILAITLPYELCYSNILTMLDLAGIPLFAKDREHDEGPLILGGGSCAIQPEPVADFFDAILIGDGEEKIIEIGKRVKDAKEQNLPKTELLKSLAQISGLYIPSLYKPIFSGGSFQRLEPKVPEAPSIIKRAVLSSLEDAHYPSKPLLPTVNIVHDRLGLEIARGCTRGCRFCQAGISYRPVRERSVEKVLDMADKGLESTGWEEISLLSLSTGDYRCITPLIEALATKYLPQKTALSLPSLRVGTLTPKIMELIKTIRKTGFTLAPEAGSERLRQVINKGITEKDLLETAKEIYEQGWSNIKLYFMIGLPTETMEDILAIAELARKVLATTKRGQVTISIGTFVPKPHTPFQWERQISEQESRERLRYLRQNLNKKAIKMKWHDPRQSFLEGVFSRGDRRLSKVILQAWLKGARLDAWTDNLNPKLYYEAAASEKIDLNTFLHERDAKTSLPWDHISTGVKKEFLLSERERAWEMAYTTDCRSNKCHKCGVCDFKTIKPVVHKKCEIITPNNIKSRAGDNSYSQTILVTYSKLNQARFLGHLDVLHTFHRAVRRAKIPVSYSQGFHPMPKIGFGQPIPLGTESLVEQAAITLKKFTAPKQIKELLNNTLPTGLYIENAKEALNKKGLMNVQFSTYLILPTGISHKDLEQAVKNYHESSEWPVEIIRKKKSRSLNAKDMIYDLKIVEPDAIEFTLRERWKPWEHAQKEGLMFLQLSLKHQASAQLKPMEFIKSLLNLNEDSIKLSRIIKIHEERSL